MNTLVFGGTRYFGKRLVELLIDRGDSVTIATRGKTTDSFGNRVERQIVDRGDPKDVTSLAETRDWDLVFDQISYSPDEAELVVDAFEGKVGRFIHTSTASVYLTEGVRPESDFDPFHCLIRMGSRSDFDYGEGKRQAEAVLFQRATFPVAAMRIPIVLGPDDYTGRLEFHIERIRNNQPIVIPNLEAETSFISSAEAARFLRWLGTNPATGPVNACSDGPISIRQIVAMIEVRLGKKARIVAAGPDSEHTPFVDEKRLKCLDSRRAQDLGFQFTSVMSWLPGLVDRLCG